MADFLSLPRFFIHDRHGCKIARQLKGEEKNGWEPFQDVRFDDHLFTQADLITMNLSPLW